jgi:hypothetical protein
MSARRISTLRAHCIALLRGRAATDHLLHIRAVLDVLVEVADVAADLFVRLETKRDDGHEAEGEPLPALHHAAAVVAAILALHGYVLGAFEGGLEGYRVVSGCVKEGRDGRGSVLCVPHVKKKNIVAVLRRFARWIPGRLGMRLRFVVGRACYDGNGAVR